MRGDRSYLADYFDVENCVFIQTVGKCELKLLYLRLIHTLSHIFASFGY